MARTSAAPLLSLVALLLLLVPLAILVRPPQQAASFTIDEIPAQAELRNFYGVEQNSFGAFRWAKPDAAIVVPVEAPGLYRVTIILQDSSIASPGRATTLAVGDATSLIHLTPTPHEYTSEARLDPLTWGRQAIPALIINLHTDAFTPPGDPRALGAIVARVAIAPISPVAPAWRGPLLAVLATLLVGALLWWLGISITVLASAALGISLALAMLATLASESFLRLTLVPALYPLPFLSGMLGLLAAVGLAGAVGRSLPRVNDASSPDSDARTPSSWQGHAWLLLPLSLATMLRFANLSALSLWLDEGATVYFSDLSWRRVLGLQGAYDLHPPLYYAAAKVAELVVGPALGGRLVSAVAGTATIVVVYAMVTWMLGRRAGLGASLLLAVSPLHLWYSQEGRMYALGTLLVAHAALAIVGFAVEQRPLARRWWAVAFTLAALAAAYTVYSTLYTLLPLVLPILWLLWRQRRAALPLLIAAMAAALGYLPWLPQLFTTTRGIARDPGALAGRTELLAATPGAVWSSLLSVSGGGGALRIYSNSSPFPWDRWSFFDAPFLLLCVVALLLGGVILARRAPLLGGVAVCFLVGTVLVALVASMFSPGYADRTILAAVIGWAILGGALCAAMRPRWVSVVGSLGCIALLIVSSDTVATLRASAMKQQYRELLADATSVSIIGYPVAPLGSWMPAFVEAYAPTLNAATIIDGKGKLILPQRDGAPVGALWLAYADNTWDNVGVVRQQLEDQGYRRTLHKYYPRPLYLDLYMRPTTQLGQNRPVDTTFATWQRSSQAIVGSNPSILRLPANPATGASATLDIPVALHSLVTLEGMARLPQTTGALTLSLSCFDASGSRLEQESNEGAADFVRDGKWHAVQVSTLCPLRTAVVRVIIRNETSEQLEFRDPVVFVNTLEQTFP